MGKKILLADDSITIQKVIELTFSDEDFDVVTVGNGRLALEKLSEVRPDIVLCDIIMPEKDGYEVCEQIKRSPAFAHVPVLLLTGAFEPFDQERAAKAGYDGSLAKPFEPETLIAKVRDLLARAPQRGSAAPSTTAPHAVPPVVPFARPAPMAAPPPPPPARAEIADVPSFIPDEPFDADVTTAPPMPAPQALAPMSEEESATLMASPEVIETVETMDAIDPVEELETEEEEDEPQSTSTVMFKASDLPWNASPSAAPVHAPAPPPAPPPPPPPVPAPPPIAAAPPPPEHVEPSFVPEREQEFDPEQLDADAGAGETAVFEEVIEEDLEYDGGGATSIDELETGDPGSTMMFTAGSTLPPMEQPNVDNSSKTASFGTVDMEQTFSESDFEPAPPAPPQPNPYPDPEEEEPEIATVPPGSASPLFQPEPPPPPPARMAVPPVVRPPEPVAPPAPPPPPPAPPPMPAAPPEPPAAPRFERAASQSFADVAPPELEPAPAPASEAAALSVPVEMVEKIAQRVVAQISEKAVREIAWEVIPDLAEALIKQEIERLKAELQKT